MITITVLTILHISLIIALAAMLTGSMALMASNPIKTTKTETPVQSEVVSREGSEALRAVTFPGVQQTPTVPTEHNIELDAKFLKLARDEEEKRFFQDYLSDTYQNCGSYLASAKIQQALDLNIFLEFLDGNIEILKRFGPITINGETFGKDYYEEAIRLYTPQRKEEIQNLRNNVYDWISQNYFSVYSEAFNFDHPPDYREVIENMNAFTENNMLEFAPGKRMFGDKDNFRAIQEEILDRAMPQEKIKDNIRYRTIYLATRMHLLDSDLFTQLVNLFYLDNETFKIFKIYMEIAYPPERRLAY